MTMVLIVRLYRWQRDRRREAFARRAADLEAAAMGFAERLDQREAEAGAAGVVGRAATALLERQQDTRDIVDAGAVVAHFHLHHGAHARRGQRHGAARLREADRVLDELEDA